MRAPFRSSIAAQMALLLTLTATILLSIGGWLFYKRTYDDAWLYFESQMSRIATGLANTLAVPVANNDQERIKNIVDNVLLNDQVYAIMLIQDEHSAMFTRDQHNTTLPDSADHPSKPQLEITSRSIEHNGATIATLRLYMDSARLKRYLHRWVIVRALSILLFDILLIMVLYAMFWVKIFYPLKRLKEHAIAINLQEPEQFTTQNPPEIYEFKAVYHAMDAMLRRLRIQMQEISDNNESFNRMCRKFPIPIVISNPSTREILFLNEQFIEIFGYEPNDIPTLEDFHSLIFPDPEYREESEALLFNRWELAMDQDVPMYPVERVLHCKDGEIRVVEMSGVISGDNFWLTLLNDITTRYQAEKAVREQQSRLRELTAHVQEVREQERKRIAQELHDELGQILTVARIDLSNLISEEQTPVSNHLSEKIKALTSTIDEASDTARRISENLRPGMLDLLGLGPALELHVNRFMASTHIEVELNLDDEDALNVNDRVATTAFRIVQEALTNVARYAKASKVDIHVVNLGKELLIVIQDNGVGFDNTTQTDKPGFGLLGMRERANILGGSVTIDSSPGKGVRIEASLPIELHIDRRIAEQ